MRSPLLKQLADQLLRTGAELSHACRVARVVRRHPYLQASLAAGTPGAQAEHPVIQVVDRHEQIVPGVVPRDGARDLVARRRADDDVFVLGRAAFR